MDDILIDNITPSDAAVILDTYKNALHQHGGICTRINFEDVAMMSIQEFLRMEVPKLKADKENSMYAVYNGNNLQLITGSRVVKYRGVQFEECTVNDFIKNMDVNVATLECPDLYYPLIAKVDKKDRYMITVRIDNACMRYTSRGPDLDEDIYLPPLWYFVNMTHARCVDHAKIAVAPEFCIPWDSTPLKAWPLANVNYTGHICFGRDAISSEMTRWDNDNVVVYDTFNRFMLSMHNTDLLNIADYNLKQLKDLAGKAKKFSEMKEKYDFSDDTWSNTARYLFYTVCILTEPNGWKRFPYIDMPVKASQFIKED